MPIASRPPTSFGAWVLPSVVSVGATSLAWRSSMHEPWMWALLGSVLAAAIATIVVDQRASLVGKRWVAIAILGGFELVLLARLGGASPFANVWPLPGPVAGAFALNGVCLLGLAVRRAWARALGVGLGIVCVAWGGVAWVGRSGTMVEEAWLWAAHVGGGALLVHHLLSIRALADEPELFPSDKLWIGSTALAANLRLAVVAAAIAVPTLVAYALIEPGRVPSLVPMAATMAAAFTAGTLLVIFGRVLGAVVVAVGGVGLTLLCALLFATATAPLDRSLAITYTALWAPAAAVALALAYELAATIRAAWRIDRDRALS